MRYCSFRYPISENIGDEVQSLAAEQHLPSFDERIDRDQLSRVYGPHRRAVIMNGWFTKFATNWPPSPSVLPIYFGFHISPQAGILEHMLSSESIAHFKQFAPIGCRDRATLELLQDAGVPGFLSKCLTLTFPTRVASASQRDVYLVDVPESIRRIVPQSLQRGAKRVTHAVHDIYGESIKFDIARHLLGLYRDRARLVITTRLHCTLPCLAMGIPVIFFADVREARVSVASEVGLKTYPLETQGAEVDWDPGVHDISMEKQAIVTAIQEKLQAIAT